MKKVRPELNMQLMRKCTKVFVLSNLKKLERDEKRLVFGNPEMLNLTKKVKTDRVKTHK